MQFLRRALTGLFLLTLTIGLLVYAGSLFNDAWQDRISRESPERPARERVLTVTSVAVEQQDVVPVMSAFGEVRSRRMLEVRMSAAGRVVELAEGFNDGARVLAGDLLVRVDPTDAESDLLVARTELSEAQAELRDAELNLNLVQDELTASQAQADLRGQALARQQDLKQRGVSTAAAIETAALAEASANQAVVSRRLSEAAARNRLETAGNQVARAEIALADADRDLADTEIRAAFSGTLSDVSLVEGGLLTENERVATLIDPEALEVSFRLSTEQYARLLDETGGLIDAPITATLDVLGLDLQAEGRITRVSAQVGVGQTGRQLYALLDQHAGFRPGDFVSVHIEEPELRDVSVLPAAALDASSTLLAITSEDRLEVVPVDLLRRQGDAVIVRAGELLGRRVVAERSPLLGPGIRVKDISPRGDGPALTAAAEPDTIELTPERRAALIAAVEANQRMPAEAKERVLSQLRQDKVPARTVERIESRMGG